MHSKKAFVALALSVALLTACGSKQGYELIDVSDSDTAKKVEKKTEIVEQEFPITTQVDPSLAPGEHKVVQKGIRGQSKVTYEITYQNGKEISRKALKEEVIRKPVAAIIKVGAENSEEEGTQQIIGYSDPKSDRSAETPKIHNDNVDREVIDQILSSSQEWDSEGESTTSSSEDGAASSTTSVSEEKSSDESSEEGSTDSEDQSDAPEDELSNSETSDDAQSSDGEENEDPASSEDNTEETEGEDSDVDPGSATPGYDEFMEQIEDGTILSTPAE